MRTFKRFILFLILLVFLGVLCVHWVARSSAGVSFVENRIKAATGYEATIKSVRLGVGFGLMVSDLHLILKGEDDTEKKVLVVPVVEVSGLCHKSKIRLSRPVFTAFQSSLGNWTPSRLKDFVDSRIFWSSLATLGGKIDRSFEITDGAIVMKDAAGKELTTYSGLSWYHAPAKIKGHLGLQHDVVSLQCIKGQQVKLSGEWLSDGNGMYFIGPVPVEITIGGEIDVAAVETLAEVETPAEVEAPGVEAVAPVESVQEVANQVPEVGEKTEPSVSVEVPNKDLEVK